MFCWLKFTLGTFQQSARNFCLKFDGNELHKTVSVVILNVRIFVRVNVNGK